MTGPLSGIRVLDLSRAMAGPFCTQLLGDMGAEVIKVESPYGGDETRHWAPFWNDNSCYYMSANRNKRSIAINLKKSSGKEIILDLAKKSDVFIENFRPGTVQRLGLSYERLKEINPQLIYCSMSGFGQDGPRALEPAYDLKMQGFAGLMSLTGFPTGEPVRAGLPITDLIAGMYAAFGIVSALYHRSMGGTGQKIETSLLEGQIAWLSYYVVGYFANGIIPRGMGSAHHSLMPYKAYKAKDDYFILAVGNDEQWQRFCGAIESEDLARDCRFTTNVDRLKNREALDFILNSIFERYSAEELIQRLNDGGVPCGPINSLDQIVDDPQVLHLGLIQNVPHPDIPELQLPGIPLKFSATPGMIRTSPPRLGEHTDEILYEIGYSSEAIKSLYTDGAIAKFNSSSH